MHQGRWSGGSRAGGVCIRADGQVIIVAQDKWLGSRRAGGCATLRQMTL